MKKRAFVINALVLTASSILLRILFIVLRVYISGKIGSEGIGLYQLIISVYILFITFSVSGISLAVTRLVAEGLGRSDKAFVQKAMKKCLALSLGFSFTAAALLLFSAPFIGGVLLGDARTVPSLRILAVSLPFLSVAGCYKGYFIAVRKAFHAAIGEIFEQVITMAAVVVFFMLYTPSGMEQACCAIVLGSVIGEILAFGYTYLVYRILIRRQHAPDKKQTGMMRQIFHIALPIAASSYIRTGLSTLENMLIPAGFKKHGSPREGALSQYGMITGMVMPILYFPSSFLYAFSGLLVPEMAEANAANRRKGIRYTTGRAFHITLLFSIMVSGTFIAFADELGFAIYGSRAAGEILRVLSPLVPLMYLDSVVDGILKGLDQQMSSLKYNIWDSVLRIVLILILTPMYGIKGLIGVLYFSTIFNASLSINRLLKVTELQVKVMDWIAKPILCIAAAVSVTSLALHIVPWEFSIALLVSFKILLSIPLFYLFLRLTGSITKEDISWFKKVWNEVKTI